MSNLIDRSHIVSQHNTLINASYLLSLTEQRIIVLAIAKARREGISLDTNTYISVSAEEYKECFPVEKQAGYKALKEASENLFKRRFSYRKIDENNKENRIMSHWIQSVKYIEEEGRLEILFTYEVLPYITELKNNFTSYLVGEISELTSFYSIRLYEILSAWKGVGKTPEISVQELREQLGIEEGKYSRMDHFKLRVLNPALEQINKLTSITSDYEQHKTGRAITGFSFSVQVKKKALKRKRISIDEAIKISNIIEGGYAGESEWEAIGRVIRHKDQDGNPVYLLKATKQDWIDHRKKKKEISDKIEKKSKELKRRESGIKEDKKPVLDGIPLWDLEPDLFKNQS